jgi:4-amino-4-deoxychorismate lyase
MVLVNGKAVQTLSVHDRGLLYGDGLFETLAVRGGRPLQWSRHLARLKRGCARLGIEAPDAECLLEETLRVAAGARRAVVKIVVTRGAGARGYRPGGGPATRIVTAHPSPEHPPAYRRDGVAVRWCATRLGLNPALAGLKHLNRLEQVLARAEWDDPDIAEGLMQDPDGNVIEGTMSNLFAALSGELVTPDLSRCGVAGVMRERVLECAAALAIPCRIRVLGPAELETAREIFLCNSLIGIWSVRRLGERNVPRGPLAARLAAALAEEV